MRKDCQSLISCWCMVFVVWYNFYIIFCRNKWSWFKKRSHTPRISVSTVDCSKDATQKHGCLLLQINLTSQNLIWNITRVSVSAYQTNFCTSRASGYRIVLFWSSDWLVNLTEWIAACSVIFLLISGETTNLTLILLVFSEMRITETHSGFFCRKSVKT